MSILETELRTARDSLAEALRMLEKIDGKKPMREDQYVSMAIVAQAMQGAKSCAVVQGILDHTFTPR